MFESISKDKYENMEKYTYIIVRKYSRNGYMHENTEKYSYIIGEKYSKDEYEDMEKYTNDSFEYAYENILFKIFERICTKGYRIYVVGYMK